MNIKHLVPWAQQTQVPIRRSEETNYAPTLRRNLDRPFREIEQLFEQLLGTSDLPYGSLIPTNTEYVPSIDIHETDNEFHVSVEVPGMDEKDIEVSISRDLLTISGEKTQEKEENIKGSYRMERRYGSFSRSIPLAENSVDIEKAGASYKNGVLTIDLPKAANYKDHAKKIPVQSNKTNTNGGNGQTS